MDIEAVEEQMVDELTVDEDDTNEGAVVEVAVEVVGQVPGAVEHVVAADDQVTAIYEQVIEQDGATEGLVDQTKIKEVVDR
ncbi:hypothetical protein ACE6H2_023322 [Prunus campanulata]